MMSPGKGEIIVPEICPGNSRFKVELVSCLDVRNWQVATS